MRCESDESARFIARNVLTVALALCERVRAVVNTHEPASVRFTRRESFLLVVTWHNPEAPHQIVLPGKARVSIVNALHIVSRWAYRILAVIVGALYG